MTTEAAPLVIRSLEEDDLLVLHDRLAMGLDHVEARWREVIDGQRSMLIAEIDGHLAGSVSLGERDEFPGLLHLFALGVVPEFRAHGIGTALIRAIEKESRQRGLGGVYLGVANDNLDARRLYERLGYFEEGRPYVSRWTWRGHDGSQRDVVELVHRLFKRWG